VYNQFRSRLELTGTVTLTTALRIGAGRSLEPDAPDLPVVKDIWGKPYIPGSSFKGVLRTHAESLLRAIEPDQDKSRKLACNPLSEAKLSTGQKYRRCIAPDEMQELKRGPKDNFDEVLLAHTCLACGLFGAQWFASPVQIRDMPLTVEMRPYARFEQRNGVAINRDTETSENGALYDFEVVPAQMSFEFAALIENAEPYQLGLFFLALRSFERGSKPLGGATSRGLGGIQLNWTGNFLDAQNTLAGKTGTLPKLDALIALFDGSEGQKVLPGDLQVKSWVEAFRNEMAKRLGETNV